MKTVIVLAVLYEFQFFYDVRSEQWTLWKTEFAGECMHSCDRFIYDTRKCIGENSHCMGVFVKTRLERCKKDSCEIVNGVWGRWELLRQGHCTVTCGYGYREILIRRECNDPAPVGQGLYCQGQQEQNYNESCFINIPCGANGYGSLDGGWSPWTQAEVKPCPLSCGIGYYGIPYVRTCTRPSPTNGGKNCVGPQRKINVEKCFLKDCTVNGGWNEWFVYSARECDLNNCQQKVTYQRVCTKPAPSPSGSPCPGDSQRGGYRDCCDRNACSKAQWSSWGADIKGVCVRECERYIYNTRKCVGENRYCYGSFVKYRLEKCKEDSCEMVNGGWSRWELISQEHCTVTCGYGYRTVHISRKCDDPAPVGQGLDCQGLKERNYKTACFRDTRCGNGFGSLDGEWSPWIQSGLVPCSVTCGLGTHIVPYERTCTRPRPMNGGNNCTGPVKKSITQKCFLKECIVSGGWNEWFVQSVKKCDLNNCQQEITYQRLCTNPAPSPTGSPCRGESQLVSFRDCCDKDVNNRAIWTVWSEPINDECLSTCQRYVYYTRQCDGELRYCYGGFVKSRLEACDEDSCKIVHGGWSLWEIVTHGRCSVTCGYGYVNMHVQRECNNPKPVGRGMTCQGPNDRRYKTVCYIHTHCVTGYGSVDGDWSPWAETRIDPCNVVCGFGNRSVSYARKCDNPRPVNGGKNCIGQYTKTGVEICIQKECIVNGGWNSWFIYTVRKCDFNNCQQKVIHQRLCTNPAPTPSGLPCHGDSQRVSYRDCCDKDPNRQQWTAWGNDFKGECEHACIRYIYNSRQCNGPNSLCYGLFVKSRLEQCIEESCETVHGGWGLWEIMSQEYCTVTCGYGTRVSRLRRLCDSPKPSGRGLTCEGPREQSMIDICFKFVKCENGYGSVDAGWSVWVQSDLPQCDVTCGIGNAIVPYVRTCENPRPRSGGNSCEGPDKKTEKQKCSYRECIVDGGWNPWFVERVEQCDLKTCKQTITHKRLCTNPAPSPNGSPCPGESQSLSYRDCCEKIDGGWNSWSPENQGSCSGTCGLSIIVVTQRRECNKPEPLYGGKNCTGITTKVHTESCVEKGKAIAADVQGNSKSLAANIAEHGGWSPWELKMIKCSVTCGEGRIITHKSRKCNNPKPRFGGNYCKGRAIDETRAFCQRDPCPELIRTTKWKKQSNGNEVVYRSSTAAIFAVAVALISLYCYKKRRRRSVRKENIMKAPLYKKEKKSSNELLPYDNPVSENDKH